uniref:Uncharacterized protein n=1 Tax=viral metagenome TaxID=1070528 RepID=A0A6C0BV33_9ZZZZ
MDSKYLIIDPRPPECFKDQTFCGYKKRDVISALLKSIESGKVENSCFWLTECLVSGYIFELLDKLIVFGGKVIHINNPYLPSFLWDRYSSFMKSIDHLNKKDKRQFIHLRNTQSIRNSFTDIVITLTTSSKNKRYDKYPKLKEDIDFSLHSMKKKMNATMQLLPSHIIKFTDPEELRVIMNEFFFNLKNKHGGYDNCIYWIIWLVQWEKINKKKKISFEIEERPIKNIHKKYCRDLIWLVWSVIFEEANTRGQSIKIQIQHLFLLYKDNFSSGKRNLRLPLVYNAIGYLTLPVKFNIPIRSNYDIYIKTQCNVNKLFIEKKKFETKEYVEPEKPTKKIIGTEKEISLSKLNQISEIDQIFIK